MYKNKKTEKAVKWAKENPEKFKLSQKRYRDKKKLSITEEDRVKARAQSNKWRINNPDKIRERKREYVHKRRFEDPEFREKLKKRKREWDAKNVEHVKQYAKERYAKTYPIIRDHHLKYMHDKGVNKRLEILYWYSNGEMNCNECGELHYEFLAVDHMDNNGYAHRSSGELKKYSNNIINYLIGNNFPEGYQILCHNCNQIKRMELMPPIKDTAYTRHRRKYRKLMLNKYSGSDIKCKYCGIKDERCLTFHHVNGGGTKEKRENKYNDTAIYLYHNNTPLEEIEILCQNCNKSLGHYGYLPFDQK